MFPLIAGAFLLGIVGSLHCIGMCGPLVLRLPFLQKDKGSPLPAAISYHAGKTFCYGLLGLLAGSIGKGFSFFQWQQGLSILAGLSLLVLTLLPAIKARIGMPAFIQRSLNSLFARSGSQNTFSFFLAFGFLNGFLPCGLVYTALAGAIVSGSPLHGFLFMILFGIGTIPSLMSVILLQHTLGNRFRKYMFKSSYYISIVIGVLLVVRGLDLGVPYISPHYNTVSHEMNCCHKK